MKLPFHPLRSEREFIMLEMQFLSVYNTKKGA